jgi:tetratricopeptide (TPR) repeat protein
MRILLLLFFLIKPVWGESSASFLKLEEGARPAGMGGAFVGLADDASTLYWNPAGLAYIGEKKFLLGYNSLDYGISSSSLFLTWPLYLSSIGLSLTHFGLDGVEKRTIQKDEPDGETGSDDLLARIGIGKKINPSFSYGASVGYIRESLDKYKAETYFIDLGGLYQKEWMRLGLSLKNIGGSLRFIDKGYSLPKSLAFGVSAQRDKWYLLSAIERLLVEEKTKVRFGIEHSPYRLLSLRLGFCYKDEPSYSMGVGIKVKDWHLDYAFLPFSDIASTHQISLVSQPQKEVRDLSIEKIQIDNIFPSKSMYYTKNPVGEMILTNGFQEPVKVKIHLIIPKVMEYPYEHEEIEIRPKETASISLYASLKNEILARIDENMPLQAKIEIDIAAGKKKEKRSMVKPLILLGRNAIDWNNPENIAAFVTPNDTTIKSFSRQVVGEGGRYLLGIRRACEVFSALKLYGISFITDPNIPSGLDSVQYPVETLHYKSGDCDDLSSLYASCLESIGTRVAFLSIPGHILLLFDTGITSKNSHLIGSGKEYLMIDDHIFLPLETTRSSFTEALNEGMAELIRWKENARIIMVSDAWKTYPPFGFSAEGLKIEPPNRVEVEREADTQMNGFLKERERSYKNEIERLEKAEDYLSQNRLGMLYLTTGKIEEAKAIFVKTKSYTNLGNILLLEGNTEDALVKYGLGLALAPKNPKIMLNIGIAYSVQGMLDEASEVFLSAMKVYPDINQMERDLGYRLPSSLKGDNGDSLPANIKAALFKAKEKIFKTLEGSEARKRGLITSGVREIKGEGWEEKEFLALLLCWEL